MVFRKPYVVTEAEFACSTPTDPMRSTGLGFMQRFVIDKIYRRAAGDPSKLPWHRDDPGALLVKCASQRRPGRALDVGCGSGVFSRWLASLGYDVVAIDAHPDAVAMAEKLAARGPAFRVEQADILQYSASAPFDLVLDSGCLHNFNRRGVGIYRARLADWLAPDGDFVLEHWGKRHPLDWRTIGPYRRSAATIEAAFAPAFSLQEALSETIEVPFPLGPTVRGVAYHFKRARLRS